MRSSAPVGNSHFQIGCVIDEYGLCNTTTLIQNLIYIRFGIILTQFLINFSRQEHQIDVLYIYHSKPEILRFQPIPPFIFPLQSL